MAVHLLQPCSSTSCLQRHAESSKLNHSSLHSRGSRHGASYGNVAMKGLRRVVQKERRAENSFGCLHDNNVGSSSRSSRKSERRLNSLRLRAMSSMEEQGELRGKELFDSVLKRMRGGEGRESLTTREGEGERGGSVEVLSVPADVRERVQQKLKSHFTQIDEEQSTAAASASSSTSSVLDSSDSAASLLKAPLADQLRSQRPIMRNSAEWLQERRQEAERRRQQGLDEYSQLKQQLLSSTAVISGLGAAYCAFLLSLQDTVSYATGSFFSLLYLLLLFRDVDQVSKDSLPPEFTSKKSRRRGLVDSRNSVDSIRKVLAGSTLALKSQRLVVPALLMATWAASLALAKEDNGAHLEFAPLFLGFLSYKAAVLVRTFQDNKDGLL